MHNHASRALVPYRCTQLRVDSAHCSMCNAGQKEQKSTLAISLYTLVSVRRPSVHPFILLSMYDRCKFLLYISEQKRVVGCAVVERIECAHTLLQDSERARATKVCLARRTASAPQRAFAAALGSRGCVPCLAAERASVL